jgi:spermidine/putrescine transport system permease protein
MAATEQAMPSPRVIAGRRRRAGRLGGVAQLGPPAFFYAIFFLAPLAILVAYSFFLNDQVDLRVEPAFTLENYDTATKGGLYRELILRTVLLGLVVAVVVVFVGYVFAYIATFTFPRHRELLLFLVLASIFGGYLVRIYAWRTILGEEGLVNSMLSSIGLIDEPLKFLIFSRFAVVVTLVNFLLPFGILPLYAAMQNVPRDAVEAARDLGGGPLAVFRTVTLPLTSTGVRVAFAFAFVLAAGDFVTPALVGGTNGQMIGNVIADQFGVAFNWPLGAALAVVTLLVVLVVYWLAGLVLRVVAR